MAASICPSVWNLWDASHQLGRHMKTPRQRSSKDYIIKINQSLQTSMFHCCFDEEFTKVFSQNKYQINIINPHVLEFCWICISCQSIQSWARDSEPRPNYREATQSWATPRPGRRSQGKMDGKWKMTLRWPSDWVPNLVSLPESETKYPG
jgi:hypothetical protein